MTSVYQNVGISKNGPVKWVGIQYRTGFAAAFVDNDASAANVLLLLASASPPACNFASPGNAAYVLVVVVLVICPKPYTFG